MLLLSVRPFMHAESVDHSLSSKSHKVLLFKYPSIHSDIYEATSNSNWLYFAIRSPMPFGNVWWRNLSANPFFVCVCAEVTSPCGDPTSYSTGTRGEPNWVRNMGTDFQFVLLNTKLVFVSKWFLFALFIDLRWAFPISEPSQKHWNYSLQLFQRSSDDYTFRNVMNSLCVLCSQRK